MKYIIEIPVQVEIKDSSHSAEQDVSKELDKLQHLLIQEITRFYQSSFLEISIEPPCYINPVREVPILNRNSIFQK